MADEEEVFVDDSDCEEIDIDEVPEQIGTLGGIDGGCCGVVEAARQSQKRKQSKGDRCGVTCKKFLCKGHLVQWRQLLDPTQKATIVTAFVEATPAVSPEILESGYQSLKRSFISREIQKSHAAIRSLEESGAKQVQRRGAAAYADKAATSVIVESGACVFFLYDLITILSNTHASQCAGLYQQFDKEFLAKGSPGGKRKAALLLQSAAEGSSSVGERELLRRLNNFETELRALRGEVASLTTWRGKAHSAVRRLIEHIVITAPVEVQRELSKEMGALEMLEEQRILDAHIAALSAAAQVMQLGS
jgi:hypothetical protein